MIANILGQGSQLREYASDVEEKLRQVELESIQVCQSSDVEYMAEANVEIGFSVTEIPVYCKVCLVKLSWGPYLVESGMHLLSRFEQKSLILLKMWQ